MRLRNGLCYMREYLLQSGIPHLPKLISKKFRQLDDPIISMFAEDYYLKKKFVRTVILRNLPLSMANFRFPTFPSSSELLRSSSLFFVNTDPLLEFPRALSPVVIPVGGLHVDQPKPLFAPWNTSIESARDGLIVVSLGTQRESAYMTKAEASTSTLMYKLSHKSCKLLVTNGGMSASCEGLGLMVNKKELREDRLLSAMKSVLQGSKYTKVAKEMSKDFRARPSTPFETALHYIELVGRHRGSGFYGVQLVNPLLTLNLDFLLLTLVAAYLICYLLLQSFFLICRRSSIPSIVVTVDKSSQSLRTKKEN
ncbi:hypothetical protein OSTOST_21203 [Ostertagia ostertagi]